MPDLPRNDTLIEIGVMQYLQVEVADEVRRNLDLLASDDAVMKALQRVEDVPDLLLLILPGRRSLVGAFEDAPDLVFRQGVSFDGRSSQRALDEGHLIQVLRQLRLKWRAAQMLTFCTRLAQ